MMLVFIKKMIKRVLKIPKKLKLKIAQYLYTKLTEKNIFLIKLFYFFFDHSFDREMKSVLLGKKLFEKRIDNNEANISKVRREVHRIEKGLILPNRKPFFASDYIESTVDFLIASFHELDSFNKKWCCDVLIKYFDEIGNGNHSIDLSREKLHEFLSSIDLDLEVVSSVPFNQSQLEKTPIVYDDLLSLAKRRHSVRFFKDVKVEKEKLEKALDIGLQSPSACNRQPFEVLFFNQEELLSEALKLPMGITTFMGEIKNIAIIVGDLSYYFSERDRHLIYVDGSLFTMAFLFGLEVQGISSCVINWPDIEAYEKEFHKIFNIPSHKRGVCFIALGYAKETGKIPYSEKKESSKILKYNEIYTGR